MKKRISQHFHRRNFLKVCTRIALSLASLLGLGGLIRFFSFQPDPGSPTRHLLGSLENFPTSGILVRPEIPAVIYRKEQGFQAYSLICTHLGCTLEEAGNGFSCPCHGSEFDRAGKIIQGPAREELKALLVEFTDDGELLVHTGDSLP